MKSLIGHPIVIYVAAGLACLCIMVIVDYLLGTEAEHLNAWAIVNKLFGRGTGVGDSRSIQYMGLFGATLLMLIVNGLFGVLLIGFIKLLIGLVHA